MTNTEASSLVKQPRRRKAKDSPTPTRRLLGIPRDADKGIPLLQVRYEYHAFNDLIVADSTRARLERIIGGNKAGEDLLHYGLRPTNRIHPCGPPGTGKTLTAKVMATAMGYRSLFSTRMHACTGGAVRAPGRAHGRAAWRQAQGVSETPCFTSAPSGRLAASW